MLAHRMVEAIPMKLGHERQRRWRVCYRDADDKPRLVRSPNSGRPIDHGGCGQKRAREIAAEWNAQNEE